MIATNSLTKAVTCCSDPKTQLPLAATQQILSKIQYKIILTFGVGFRVLGGIGVLGRIKVLFWFSMLYECSDI